MKFSTLTVTDKNDITPWLASTGSLSYSPFSPPIKDYFFLYNFIFPKIFALDVNLRQHYWFGDYGGKDDFSVQRLLNFWNNARAEYKFGKSYVVFETPITNIRIITYFSAEYEVKITSIDKLIPINAVNCRFKEATNDDWYSDGSIKADKEAIVV